MKLHPLFILVALVALLTFASFRGLASGPGTLGVLVAMPVHVTDRDEDPERRLARLEAIAAAIDGASEHPEDRAALLALARHESHLAAYVHEGRCQDGPRGKAECDSGRAKGLWQLHGESPDDLDGQALRAIQLWRGFRKSCRSSVRDELEGAFSGYATGGRCGFAGAPHRAQTMRAILRRL